MMTDGIAKLGKNIISVGEWSSAEDIRIEGRAFARCAQPQPHDSLFRRADCAAPAV
jgi:hypothetical protein